MQVYKFDTNGFFVEPIILKNTDFLPKNTTVTRPTDTLYKPKWTGTKWVEGMTQKEINELNAPIDKGPTMAEYLLELDYRISTIELGI